MQGTRQIKQIVGENIRARRDAIGLSRRALGIKIDVDQNLIYKWERGQHRPTDENLSALSVELGTDIGWLYTDHSDEQVAA